MTSKEKLAWLAVVAERFAGDDCAILFHDLVSPGVAEGLDYLRQHGWQALIVLRFAVGSWTFQGPRKSEFATLRREVGELAIRLMSRLCSHFRSKKERVRHIATCRQGQLMVRRPGA